MRSAKLLGRTSKVFIELKWMCRNAVGQLTMYAIRNNMVNFTRLER